MIFLGAYKGHVYAFYMDTTNMKKRKVSKVKYQLVIVIKVLYLILKMAEILLNLLIYLVKLLH